MTCALIEDDCKRSGERRPRGFDLTDFCASNWLEATVLSTGTVIRPKTKLMGGKRGATGFEYIASVGGQSGEREPVWPTTLGGTVVDGSITWTCQAFSAASLFRTISSGANVTWLAATGMIVDGATLVNTGGSVKIAAYHSGGTDGDSDLLNIARVTFSDGAIEDFGINWSIHDAAE